MSKMAEMHQLIEDLRNAAAVINDTADYLSKAFSGTEKPEEKPVLKLEDVRAVLADKSRAGHTDEVRALLKKYGANRLSEVDPANYAALLKDAEVIGDAG